MTSALLHQDYLPFTADQLRPHFLPVGGRFDPEANVAYYVGQAGRYQAFHAGAYNPNERAKHAQMEKDERVWIVSALMSAFHSPERGTILPRLLARALGPEPPLPEFERWDQAFGGSLHLFFEVALPSPQGYWDWLRKNLAARQPIPYLAAEAKARKSKLEGPTHADAVLLDADTGCAIVFEAKALSDISPYVKFDVTRNQIARNVDCMLENPGLTPPLDRRDPHRTMFVLLTPRLFKENPSSRLYGWLMREYKDDPTTLRRDLPHREADWPEVSRRLGWLTWEDCEEVLPGSCRWLRPAS